MVNYSAYTIAKIALTKMCELLDAEVLDTSFVILAPGWVKTKIHQATLDAGHKAGPNYQKTITKLAGDECTPMETVLDCCDWLMKADRKVASGRNFSVVSYKGRTHPLIKKLLEDPHMFDKWGRHPLIKKLLKAPHTYKLRRHGENLGEASVLFDPAS
jgi:hypothetical protein